jgi:VWFA-related protein
MRNRLAALALVAVSGSLLLAQQSPPPSQSPTFRTGIEAVQIDAFVTDERGNPVRDLTVDDFEVIENGVPRPITTFAFVDIPIEPPLGNAGSWRPAPDVVANDGPEGRTYLFAVDVSHESIALRTRAFLRRFLEEYFGPHDVAAVVTGGRGLATFGHEVTSSPQLLLDAVGTLQGGNGCGRPTSFVSSPQGPLPMPRINTNDFGVRERVFRLRQFTELLAGVPGGRKTMLYFSNCVGFDMFDVMDYRGGVLSLAAEDAHAAMAAATRGNVVIYPIDPQGLTPQLGFESLEKRADLVALAAPTGGFALANSNSFTAAFDRILQENSTYYVLGFNSAYERRDGRLVRLDVRVKRPGLRVRTREGYLAPLGRPRRTNAVGEDAAPVLQAVATPVSVRGVGLRVFAAPYKGTGREAAVALAFEVDGSGVTLVEQDGEYRGELDVTYTPVSAQNRAYPGARHSMALALTPDRYEEVTRDGMRVASQLALPAGRYQIRVAVASGSRTGSVVYDLDVPDFGRNGLHMSGLSFTSAAAARVLTMRPEPSGSGQRNATRCRPPTCVVPLVMDGAPSGEDPLREALSGPPTTVRDFERSDTVELYVEVYENVRRPPAHTIELATELRGEDGRILPLTAEKRPSVGPTRPSGGYGFTATLPLHDVPPGAYVLHVEARSDLRDGSTVSRAVPIRVR